MGSSTRSNRSGDRSRDTSTGQRSSKERLSGERLSAQVLGPLVVARGEHVLTAKELGGPRQRQILEILLVQPGTPVSKHRLIELLWGHDAPAGALGTVESYVSVLRRSLQPGHARNGALKTTDGGYLMDPAMVEVDLDRFDRLYEAAQCCSTREAYPLLVQALGLAGAPLLENELSSEWAGSQRALHATRVVQARVLAAEAALGLGLEQEAVAQARAVLAEEPVNERAWTMLILGLEATGHPVEALQAYDRCRRVLDQELGCAPGAALQSAHRRVLQATAATDDELAQAVSALLVLHGHSDEFLPRTESLFGAPNARARREAAGVLRAFLGRTLSPAT